MEVQLWESGVGIDPMCIIQSGACIFIIISFLIALYYLKWDVYHLPFLLLLGRTSMMLIITYFGMSNIYYIIFVIFDQLIFKTIAFAVLYSFKRYAHTCICLFLLYGSLNIVLTWFIHKTDSIRLCSNLLICIILIIGTKRHAYMVIANILIIMNVMRLYKYHHGLDTLLFTIGENTCITLVCAIWTVSITKNDIYDVEDDVYLHEAIPIPQDEINTNDITGTRPPLPCEHYV